MTHYFDISTHRQIAAAGRNHYTVPLLHPSRIMQEHDLVYMLDGTWKIGQEQEEFELKTGDVIILEANRAHYGIGKCSDNTKTLFVHAQCLEGDCEEVGAISLPTLISTQGNYNVRRCFEKTVYANACSDGQMGAVYFNALLYELKACTQPHSVNSIAEQIHRKLIFSDGIPTNGEIADELHISLKTAETSFKKAYGTTIHRYLTELKIDQGKSYLTDFPDMMIYEIAAMLGFYDEFHFSKQFKKIVGISPKEYRASKNRTT